MIALFRRFFDWLRSLFWTRELEVTIVGLQSAGKTTFVEEIATGEYKEDFIPTVGFNMRRIVKGRVVIKVWDLGGQSRFRSMWERYCRGVNAIIFMVDAADFARIDEAREELHQLLSKQQLAFIPLLVLGNKQDLPNTLDQAELIDKLQLESIQNREVCCYTISCKSRENLDITLQWLITRSKA